MSKFFRRAIRVCGLCAIFASAFSSAGAEACDRPHYSRPMVRPVQSRIPPEGKSPSVATPAPAEDGEPADDVREVPATPARPAASESAPGGGVKAKVGRERYPH